MNFIGPLSSGPAVGGAGVALSDQDSAVAIHGDLRAIHVAYLGAPPAGTTDVLITTRGTAPLPPTQTLLNLVNAATDGWFYPLVSGHDNLGASIAGNNGPWRYYPLADFVNISIDQANVDDSVDVWLLIDSSGYY